MFLGETSKHSIWLTRVMQLLLSNAAADERQRMEALDDSVGVRGL